MSLSNWGAGETKFFYDLSPEKVLDAAESIGVRTTGRLLQFNSMENRVYEVELDLEFASEDKWASKKIIKFYRPGRWSKNQILDEHKFLIDLKNEGIPVAAPEIFDNGTTIKKLEEINYFWQSGYWKARKSAGKNPAVF